MQKTKIEWCDVSWNPISGCNGGCSYCYARRMYRRFKRSFKPTFHPEELKKLYKLKKPSKIFVCSVSDFWGQGVKESWRQQVIKAIQDNPKHRYFILTKQPQNIDYQKHIEKIWGSSVFVGVSIEDNSKMWRWLVLKDILGGSSLDVKKFISFEPLLGAVDMKFDECPPDWIVIGGLTGKKVDLGSQNYWANWLLKQIPRGISVFIKDNLKWTDEKIQELPI